MFRVIFPSLCFFTAWAHAGLQWEKPIQSFDRSPEDRHVTATFAFRNTGSAPVTIKSVKTSCGCTSARLAKKTFAPGESGEIAAKFTFRKKAGVQRTLVTVKTDDTPEPAVLDIRVMLREGVTVTPSLLFWRVGEPAAAKGVQLTANGQPVRVNSVSSTNPRLAASLETVKAGEQYVINVKPDDTSQKESGEVRVATDFPPDDPRTYAIHVRVK